MDEAPAFIPEILGRRETIATIFAGGDAPQIADQHLCIGERVVFMIVDLRPIRREEVRVKRPQHMDIAAKRVAPVLRECQGARGGSAQLDVDRTGLPHMRLAGENFGRADGTYGAQHRRRIPP